MRIHPLNRLLVWVIVLRNKSYISFSILEAVYEDEQTRQPSKWTLLTVELVFCFFSIAHDAMWMRCRTGAAFIGLKETFPWCLMPAGWWWNFGAKVNCCRVWNNCSKLTWCEDTVGQLHLHPSRPQSRMTLRPGPWLLLPPSTWTLIQLV